MLQRYENIPNPQRGMPKIFAISHNPREVKKMIKKLVCL